MDWLLAGAALGAAKAVRDTVQFHWGRTWLRRLPWPWLVRWLESDWRRRPRHPLWFLWDGWHCADTVSYAAAFWLAWTGNLAHVAAGVAVAMAVFNLLFHVVLVDR